VQRETTRPPLRRVQAVDGSRDASVHRAMALRHATMREGWTGCASAKPPAVTGGLEAFARKPYGFSSFVVGVCIGMNSTANHRYRERVTAM